MEIKLEKRVKYAGDVHTELMKAGFTPKGAAELLDHVPDADVSTVVHGKWTAGMSTTIDTTKCSVCGKVFQAYYSDYQYCPRCGARMDG